MRPTCRVDAAVSLGGGPPPSRAARGFFCYFFPFNEEKMEKAKGGHQTKSKQRTNELDLIPPLRPSRAAGAHTNSQFSLVVLLIMTSLTS